MSELFSCVVMGTVSLMCDGCVLCGVILSPLSLFVRQRSWWQSQVRQWKVKLLMIMVFSLLCGVIVFEAADEKGPDFQDLMQIFAEAYFKRAGIWHLVLSFILRIESLMMGYNFNRGDFDMIINWFDCVLFWCSTFWFVYSLLWFWTNMFLVSKICLPDCHCKKMDAHLVSLTFSFKGS